MSIRHYSFNKSAHNPQDLVGKYIFKEGILVCPCYSLIGRVKSVSGVTALVERIPFRKENDTFIQIEDDLGEIETLKARISTINLVADTMEEVINVKDFSRKQISEYHAFMKSQKEKYQNFPTE